ncbi:MAG: hypothetical protein ACJAX5_002379 [Patiriisocius sp.]|jgi:hypothetical protein
MGIQIHRLRVLGLVLLVGCQSPMLVLPGKALQGEVQQVESFAFAAGFDFLVLETRSEQPYSVNLRVTVINGELYIDASPGRRWAQHLIESPICRIKLGDALFEAVAIEVTDPNIKNRFLSQRRIYRMEPWRN